MVAIIHKQIVLELGLAAPLHCGEVALQQFTPSNCLQGLAASSLTVKFNRAKILLGE